jgi:hypothetical protein
VSTLRRQPAALTGSAPPDSAAVKDATPGRATPAAS